MAGKARKRLAVRKVCLGKRRKAVKGAVVPHAVASAAYRAVAPKGTPQRAHVLAWLGQLARAGGADPAAVYGLERVLDVVKNGGQIPDAPDGTHAALVVASSSGCTLLARHLRSLCAACGVPLVWCDDITPALTRLAGKTDAAPPTAAAFCGAVPESVRAAASI
eukprot:TRINITY_DN8617_c0_g2_i1.p3 TRINITY_DN8617_c0_g2~~TRINITY_DN8617_c0_g2_i1.p3  ORF type:complete len:164 (+),score=27.36 TRINITY_DN8617_c0_g2_i1:54-545(+)